MYTSPRPDILSVDIQPDRVEVAYREPSQRVLLCHPPRPAPDRVWKEQWEIRDGKLFLARTIHGMHQPPEHLPERISWPVEAEGGRS